MELSPQLARCSAAKRASARWIAGFLTIVLAALTAHADDVLPAPRVKTIECDLSSIGLPYLGWSANPVATLTDAYVGATVRCYIEFTIATDFAGCGGIWDPATGCPAVAPLFSYPTAGEDGSGSVHFARAVWISRYFLQFDLALSDANQDIPNIDVQVNGGYARKDESWIIADPTLFTDAFSIDTENPTVVSVTPNLAILRDANAGAGTFTLTIEYSEPMNPSYVPTVDFPDADMSATLSRAGGSWLDSTTYEAIFDVSDANQSVNDIAVSVSGGRDAHPDIAGKTVANRQVERTVLSVFSVQMPKSADPFSCYRIIHPGQSFASQTANLEDAYTQVTRQLRAPFLLCNPTDQGGADPDTAQHPIHLLGYRLPGKPLPPLHVSVHSEFIDGALALHGPSTLLTAAAASFSSPPAALRAPTGSFACYRATRAHSAARSSAIGPLSLSDTFGSASASLIRPLRLCLPADLDSTDPAALQGTEGLLCYRLSRGSRANVGRVFVHDALNQAVVLPTLRESYCVPTQIDAD